TSLPLDVSHSRLGETSHSTRSWVAMRLTARRASAYLIPVSAQNSRRIQGSALVLSAPQRAVWTLDEGTVSRSTAGVASPSFRTYLSGRRSWFGLPSVPV